MPTGFEIGLQRVEYVARDLAGRTRDHHQVGIGGYVRSWEAEEQLLREVHSLFTFKGFFEGAETCGGLGVVGIAFAFSGSRNDRRSSCCPWRP